MFKMKTIFILQCGFFFLFVGCSVPDSIWAYDANYTMDLLFNTSGYYSKAIPNSIASVDAIQIYSIEVKEDHVLPLKALRQKRLVGELRNKESIVTFLESFQKVSDRGIGDCSVNKATRLFHIVAFDATLSRVAYFRYYLCSTNEIKYGIIRSLGDEGIFYNKEPPAFILDKK